MKSLRTSLRWHRTASPVPGQIVHRVAAVMVWLSTAALCHAQMNSGYGQSLPYGMAYGQQYCPPSMPGMPYAPAPFYVPSQQMGPPGSWAPQSPMQQYPGRSLPGQPQYDNQPSQSPGGTTPDRGMDVNNGSGDPAASSTPNTLDQVQNAANQNVDGNNASNIFQASLEQELGGQGADRFGGSGYGDLTPANAIGDFFSGRLQARRSLIPMGQEYLFFDGQQPDFFQQVDTTQPALLDNYGYQIDQNGAIGNDVQFTVTNQTVSVLGIPVTALRADNIGLSPTAPGQAPIVGNDRFVLQTVGVLSGDHPNPTNPAQQFTEDTNRNGVLDPGEDLNGNGQINRLTERRTVTGQMPNFTGGVTLVTKDVDVPQTEVFGLFREVVLPNPGDTVGRLKAAENNNPIPRDRIVFDYTFFENARVTSLGSDVQRFAPGFEKTFFGGMSSIDVRVPFATTVSGGISTSQSSDDIAGGLTNTSATVLGNVSVTGKVMLAQSEHAALSTGVQVLLPTADDVVVSDIRFPQNELLRIENEALHVMPFLAWQFTPTVRHFFQYYVQYDTESKGNPLSLRGAPVGSIDNADFLYADFSAGYWMYRNPPRTRTVRHGNQFHTAVDGNPFLTGFAPRFELHYNRSLGDVNGLRVPDGPQGGEFSIGDTVDKLESLNVTVGSTLQFGIDKELTLAWGAPLLDRNDQDIDHEFRVMFNWLLPQ